jgi:hypothetical protein
MDEEDIFYDIPNASKYKMRKRGAKVFRILKSGKLRPLKKQLVIRKDGYRFRKVGITYDDGKRRETDLNVLYRKLLLLNGETPVGWLRSLPEGSEWCDTYTLSPEYYINELGDVYRRKEDMLGQAYYKQCYYYLDTTNDRSPIERVNIYTSEFRPRTYSRTAIKKLWLSKSGYIPDEELT